MMFFSIARDKQHLGGERWSCMTRLLGSTSLTSFNGIDFSDLSQLTIETFASIEDGTQTIETDDALILLKIREQLTAAADQNFNGNSQGAFFGIVPETGWKKFKAASKGKKIKL